MNIERIIIYLLGTAFAFNIVIPAGIIGCALIHFLAQIGVI